MEIAVTLRNMGPQSSREVMAEGVQAAEAAGFESVWITDHIAIPPDDAEGSGGRYTDPLTTLAWLGGMTSQIKLGVGVLVVPYRPALPTIKQIATVQELTGERLLLGLGVGWMDAEFKALGVDRHQRGRLTDQMLDLLNQCFDQDIVSCNGQDFIFSPRPAKPQVYIGGAAPHALKRAIRSGAGWMPMARDPQRLQQDLHTYDDLAKSAGVKKGPVTVMTGLPLQEPEKGRELMATYQRLGVDRLVCALRYDNVAEYQAQLTVLAELMGS